MIIVPFNAIGAGDDRIDGGANNGAIVLVISWAAMTAFAGLFAPQPVITGVMTRQSQRAMGQETSGF